MPVPLRHLTQPALADLADIPARSRWIRSADLRLHVLDYGRDGVPLVILPGITSPAVTMDFVARHLTDAVRPIVVDVRGRGLSDRGPGYTLRDYADDTEAVIDGLGLDRPLLLGHSMGARIAAATAARGSRPLRGTLLVDPPMSGPGRGPYPTSLAVFREQLAQAQRGTGPDEVARWWPGWPPREHGLRARWLASCDAEAVDATHRGFETEDFFDHWPHVPAPVWFVHGADSPVVTAADAADAARAHPRARLAAVSGARHMVFWDNFTGALDAVRTAILGILESGGTAEEARQGAPGMRHA
ncbi:alpha/beta fold hydrolase [Streptomyces sp. NPDC054834]